MHAISPTAHRTTRGNAPHAMLSRRGFTTLAATGAAAALLAAARTPTAIASESASPDDAATADLVVVGAGAAGLAAAAKAAQGGASVIVLAAESSAGGTTKICGGHWKFINDWFLEHLPERTEDSDAEVAEVLDYDPADFGDYADALTTCQQQVEEYLAGDSTLEFDSVEYWLVLHQLWTRGTDLDGNEATTDYDVVASAYYNQGEIADWLEEGGLVWSDPQPDNRGAGGPLSVEPDGQGMGFVTVLEDMATKAGAQIVLDTKVTALMADESGRVTGVVAQGPDGEVAYAASKGVVLAAGGFASNPELVASSQRLYAGIDDTVPSCEPTACDGAMIEAAQGLGATTANMQFVQFFAFPAAQMITIEQMIPLSFKGFKLTVDGDGARYDKSAVDPCDLPGGRYYGIGDASAQETLGDAWDTYAELGIICPGDTIEDAAKAGGLPSDATAATVEAFNGYCDDGVDPESGRELTSEDKVQAAPFFVTPMAMYAQNTMGGLVIDTDARVLKEDGTPIEGLYAAGEVCGNMDGARRRHGDNFAHILWYGYRAGQVASEA